MVSVYGILVFIGIIVAFLRYSFWRRKYSRVIPGKPPRFLNIFGDLVEIWQSKDVYFGFMDMLRKRVELFQNQKIFCVWAAYTPFVFFFKAEAVKELLRNNKMNEKSWLYEWIQPILGKGLTTRSPVFLHIKVNNLNIKDAMASKSLETSALKDEACRIGHPNSKFMKELAAFGNQLRALYKMKYKNSTKTTSIWCYVKSQVYRNSPSYLVELKDSIRHEIPYGHPETLHSYEKSKSRRRTLAPCFYSDVLKGFQTVFSEESQKLIDVLRAETCKEFTYIAEPIALCSLDIVCETIFGVTVNALENRNFESLNSFSKASKIFMWKIYSPWQWLDTIFRNSNTGREFHYHCSILQRVTRTMIQQKKERYRKGEAETRKRKFKPLIEMLLDGQQLTEEEIEEEMDTLALAGHINTAATTRWALYLIGLDANVQTKLHEEIDGIFGKDSDRPITEKEIMTLEYLDCVVKECYRLYSSIPMFARQVHEETNICGYKIPKGTSCVVFTYYLHRDPDVFPDPERFDPDRFLPENRKNIPEYAFVPFSVGPRSCIGFKFADMELKTFVIQVLRNFTIESLDERDKITPLMAPTLHPNIPIRIKIRSRF